MVADPHLADVLDDDVKHVSLANVIHGFSLFFVFRRIETREGLFPLRAGTAAAAVLLSALVAGISERIVDAERLAPEGDIPFGHVAVGGDDAVLDKRWNIIVNTEIEIDDL